MSTIKEVALKANVSVTTVSRVLNNNGYVHKDTKELINKVIEELNYSPNAFAEGLSKGTSNVVGILLNTITSTTTSKLVEVIEQHCIKNGFKTILGITRNLDDLEKYYLNLFKKYNIDGIIVTNKIKSINDFVKLEKPIVSIDHIISENISSVITNNEIGSNLAALELINSDCQNILLIKYTNDDDTRINNFIKTINDNNIKLTILNIDYIINKEELNKYLKNNSFDGIYTTSDSIAIPTISQLQKLKISVPSECSVVSFDNSPFSTLIYPPLTSVDYPVDELGTKSFEKLLEHITDKTEPSHIIIDIDLIKRESTKNKL